VTGSPPLDRPFHIMAKPIGSACNLDCEYCYYLEKEKLYPGRGNPRMTEATLERFIRDYIAAQPTDIVTFAWQGGEPTLLGLEFFRKAVALQRRYAGSKRIENALQTNGTLLDAEWCSFFREHGFLVGVSIDGPRKLHDAYRVDKGRRPTFDRVMRGINLLREHGVEFNTLTVVHRDNAKRPAEVYRFLKEIGSGFIQFIPLVERRAVAGTPHGLKLAEPPLSEPGEAEGECEPVTSWSVRPEAFGEFLVAVFDEWVREDVGRVFVQIFDGSLGKWMGMPGGVCVFAETCGDALAMESNGDVYSCDHYVYPRYRLGNLLEQPLPELARADSQRRFGQAKLDSLPRQCRECHVRFACNGDCPKHRFMQTRDGEPGLSYLCAGYKRFFAHIDPYMQEMAGLLRRGMPPAMIMDIVHDGSRFRR
jgi:uncharacterized protein